MKKILKIIGVFFGCLVGGLIALFILIWIAFGIGQYFYYGKYFKSRSVLAKNPGMTKGFVPQGCTYNDAEEYFLTAGYMATGDVSRIYKVDKKNKSIKFYALKSNGENFYGHTGGIQYTNGYFYLSNESDGVYCFSSELLDDSDSVEIGSVINVNNHSSYIYSDDVYLYVGEYNDDNNYPCFNEFTWNGSLNRAIVTKYALSDLTKPLEIYSVPNNIQGFAFTKNGNIVLSRSYALYPSNFLIYAKDKWHKTDSTMQGAPVYFLDRNDVTEDIVAPPMSEDLDLVDGKIIYLSECACDKYVLGKLFFDYHIYGLDLE